MLQAQTEQGQLLTLARLTRKEIDILKQKGQKFLCPTCKENVIIKAGLKVIPHFAHDSNGDCPGREGGEGNYHEKGKMLLYNWIRSQGLTVELEKYIPSIMQRPDLLLTIGRKVIAIEYQCARIPIQQMIDRSHGYERIGITPIWILGENQLNRQTQHIVKLNQFTISFLRQFSTNQPLHLKYFCPQTLHFISLQDIRMTSAYQAIGKFESKRLQSIKFTDIFTQQPFSKNELYQLWTLQKHRLRLKPRKKLYGTELSWHQWLYLNGLYVEYLPSIIYLPVTSQYLMKTSPWDWQSRIVFDLLDKIPTNNKFSVKSAEYLLRKHFNSKKLFPLVQSTQHPIREYFSLLAIIGFIRQTEETDVYQKLQPIALYKDLDSALKGDEKVMSKLLKAQIKIRA